MFHAAFVSVKMNFCTLNYNFFEIKDYNYYMREFTYQCGPSIVIGFTRISSRTDQTLQTEQVSMVSSIVHSENKFCFLP